MTLPSLSVTVPELRPLTAIRGVAAALVILLRFHGFVDLFPSLHHLNTLWTKGKKSTANERSS